ncbi:MAG: PilZ domain-containing protein [Magnetococcales bacterium]|nr:PilZ domain-containing protein [Magnetococcales bacterium]
MVTSTTFRDNPFFIHYGKTVDQCFGKDMAVGSPISVFPALIQGVDYSSESGQSTHKSLADYADKTQMRLFEEKVNRLREALLDEEQKLGSSSHTPITQKLKEFRNGLAQGSEAMLEENPFFELTALIYQISMKAMRQAFVAEQKDVDVDMPRAITTSRSLAHIWGRGGALMPLKQKLNETLAKVASVGKIGFGLLLFVGSTLTTAKGVVDLVQLPAFVEMFGDGLLGSEHEEARTALSLFIGLVLSSVILDFKSRLFQGMAETGAVFKGFWNAFKLYPRWVFISCFLTMISIWTNYDGIVLLMSKTQDLSYQWKKIEKQVDSALGDPENLDPDNPDSLNDLKAALAKKADLALKKFEMVPEDEMSGAASSGIASKGPRYWAKYYIIHGGFKLGTNDVAHSYKNTWFVQKIDIILHRSNLDLSTSLADKIAAIQTKYNNHLDQCQTSVHEGMADLGSKMVLDSYSLKKLTTLFNLEAYHINDSVQNVVKHLEANKERFAETAKEINELAKNYIELLRKIDKIGTPANNEYIIDVNIDIPKVEAIDQLKQGEIPKAKRRGLAELKDLLLDRHGSIIGGGILFLILFVAIFMDMSDPILYSAMVARWGRKDRHFLKENMKRFVDWEEKYVTNLRSFFVKPDVQPLLPKLTCPRNLVFRNGYNHFLEDMDSRVKDSSTRNFVERFSFWFQDLFVNTRMIHVGEYNARQTVVRTLIQERERYAPRLIDKIFKGLSPDFVPGRDNFDLIFKSVAKASDQDESDFFAALNTYIPGSSPTDTLVYREPKIENAQINQNKSGLMNSFVGVVLRNIKDFFHKVFNKGLIDPVPASPLTRISWIKSVAKAQVQSSADINYLSQFTPDLENWLVQKRFPVIQQEILDPLDTVLSQIPNMKALDAALEITATQKQYQHLKGVLTEVLGLSIFRGFHLQKNTLANILDSSGVDEARAVFLSREMEVAALETVIDKVESHLSRTYALVKTLVEEQNPIVFTLTKIRRDYLSPINTILNRLHNRPLIEESLGVKNLTAQIVSCEKFMLQLWDENAADNENDTSKVSVNYDIKQTETNPIINFFFCNKESVEFTLLDEIKRLENTMAQTHKRLNAIIFTLTFIDKLSVKVLTQVDNCANIVNQILESDQHQQIHDQTRSEEDQKKVNFLDDNRLFFRSIPMQLKTIKSKITQLLKDPSLSEPYNVELFRKLDNQVFKLHNFLKGSLDYLEDRRDGIGLSAALAQVSPQFAGKEPEQTITGKLSTAPSQSQTKQICLSIKEMLEKISLKEWDMLKLPIPPQKGLAVMKQNKQFIDKAWIDVEDISYSVEQLNSEQNSADEEKNKLEQLQGRAEALLEKLKTIYEQISQPFFADRRLENDSNLTEEQKAEKRAEQQLFRKEQPEFCQQPAPNSRRSNERVHLTSPIALTTIVGNHEIRGEIADVSVNGLCIKSDKHPTDIPSDSQALFKFENEKSGKEFPCRVVRVSGNMIIVTINQDLESDFSKLVRTFII